MQISIYTMPELDIKVVSTDNPKRDLTDDEAIALLTHLFSDDTKIMAVNQSKCIVLIKECSGDLKAYSYSYSHVNQLSDNGHSYKLEHYLLGALQLTSKDFQSDFSSQPVGELKRFTSTTDHLYVAVTRVGKRRKMIDEIGNIFIKVFNNYLKFPEQIEY